MWFLSPLLKPQQWLSQLRLKSQRLHRHLLLFRLSLRLQVQDLQLAHRARPLQRGLRPGLLEGRPHGALDARRHAPLQVVGPEEDGGRRGGLSPGLHLLQSSLEVRERRRRLGVAGGPARRLVAPRLVGEERYLLSRPGDASAPGAGITYSRESIENTLALLQPA